MVLTNGGTRLKYASYNIKINSNFKEPLFYFAMILNSLYMSIYITVYDVPFSTAFAVLIFALYLSVILLSIRTRKEVGIFLVLSILCLACSYVTHDTLLFRIVYMILATRDINKRKLIEFLKNTYILILIIVPLTCFFRGTESIYSDIIPGVGRTLGRRFMLGFDGPNRLGVIWICALSMILLKRGKSSLKKDTVLAIITVGLYYLTKSRSLAITGGFILIFPYFVKMTGKLKKYILSKSFIVLILIIFVGITAYFSINAVDRDSIFNVILNNRLVHFQDVINNEELTIFGSTANFGVYVGLDNSYFLNFFKRGIVFSILYLVAVIRLAYIVAQKKDIIQIDILCTYIILAFVQDVIQHPYINVIYFLIMINYFDFFGIKSKCRIRGFNSYDTKDNTLLLVR